MTENAAEPIETTSEPESDPHYEIPTMLDDDAPIVEESNEYVNVEAYAIAKCAQKLLKNFPTSTLEDEKNEMIKDMVLKVNTAIEKLQYYQNLIKSDNPKALQAIYFCQSILLIERYKLETSSFDTNEKLEQILNIMKHLSMREFKYAHVLRDQLFLEK